MRSSLIRNFIDDEVFTADAIKLFTENLYITDIVIDGEASLKAILFNGKINYCTCTVRRVSNLELCNCVGYKYLIEFIYTRERDTQIKENKLLSDSQSKILDFFEQLEDSVITAGGKNLDGLVDSISFNTDAVRTSQNTLDGRIVLVGVYTLTAQTSTELG